MSIGYLPTKPGGTDPDAAWKRSVEERLRASRIIEVNGALINRTTNGVSITPKPQLVSGGPSTPLTIHLFQFREMKKDYLLCSKGDDPTDLVRVAKPTLLRFSIVTRSIHGAFLTYINYDLVKQSRIANLGAIIGVQQEEQVIIDSYEIPDSIYAVEATTLVSVPEDDEDLERDPETTVKYLDLNVDGRYWASV